VEELALAAPQLIIDIGEPKESVVEDMDALQAQTLIPSVYISATLETMPETYRTLGRLLGREGRGEELAQFCERIYTRTRSIMDEVGENKVSCLYVLGEEGLNVIAATSYHAELLDLLTNNLAVVDNPLSTGSGNEVTMEQIALWNPDFVIFGPGSIYGAVENTQTWNQISAIVSRSYVEVPESPYNWMSMPPSVQRYLGLIWLPAVLYPEYCDYDVKADIVEYFQLFYGCTLSDAQYNTLTANAFLR
jgi:iron complex transport system substrate-binding protein